MHPDQAQELCQRLQIHSRQDSCAWMALLTQTEGGELAHGSGVRSISWKLACGALPVTKLAQDLTLTWPQVSTDLRNAYVNLRESLVVDPDEAAGDGDFDPLGGGDPLGGATVKHGETNPWEEFHKDKELLEEIHKDLERLFPSGCEEFFIQPAIMKILQTVLFTWSKLHADTSYRQGMHELAAPLLFCLYHDAKKALRAQVPKGDLEKEIAAALSQVCDFQYLEHDLFWLFERLMREMKPMFAVNSKNNRSQQEIRKAKEAMIQAQKKARALHGTRAGFGATSESPKIEEDPEKAPVLIVAEQIQNVLLAKVDRQLQEHLDELLIEPQVYALRWVRLLFGREFTIQQVMQLWDAIFVESFGLRERIMYGKDKVEARAVVELATAAVLPPTKSFQLSHESSTSAGLAETTCYFAVALLTHVREDLIAGGYSEVLMTLMKYPPIQDVHVIVQKAQEIQKSVSGQLLSVKGQASHHYHHHLHHQPSHQQLYQQHQQQQQQSATTRLMETNNNSLAPQTTASPPGPQRSNSESSKNHMVGSERLSSLQTPRLSPALPNRKTDSKASEEHTTGVNAVSAPARGAQSKTGSRKTGFRKESSIGTFFKGLGEKLEHLLDADRPSFDDANKHVDHLKQVEHELGQRLATITSEMDCLMSRDSLTDDLRVEMARLIGEVKHVRDALLRDEK